jgi:hypothetical protein
MNDTERLAALEATVAALEARDAEQQNQIAALTARDARRESEHVSLLASYSALATSREALRREADETMRLFSAYWDERISGWQQRLAMGGGDSEAMAALLPMLAKDMMEYVNRAIDHGLANLEVRIMERIATHLDRMHDVHKKLLDLHSAALDRIEALERRGR